MCECEALIGEIVEKGKGGESFCLDLKCLRSEKLRPPSERSEVDRHMSSEGKPARPSQNDPSFSGLLGVCRAPPFSLSGRPLSLARVEQLPFQRFQEASFTSQAYVVGWAEVRLNNDAA